MIEALILAQAMGGAAPADDLGRATAACSRKLAQLATRHGIVDLSSQVIAPGQQVDGRNLIRIVVVVRYKRKHGIETRRGVISCLVSTSGKVEYFEALPR